MAAAKSCSGSTPLAEQRETPHMNRPSKARCAPLILLAVFLQGPLLAQGSGGGIFNNGGTINIIGEEVKARKLDPESVGIDLRRFREVFFSEGSEAQFICHGRVTNGERGVKKVKVELNTNIPGSEGISLGKTDRNGIFNSDPITFSDPGGDGILQTEFRWSGGKRVDKTEAFCNVWAGPPCVPDGQTLCPFDGALRVTARGAAGQPAQVFNRNRQGGTVFSGNTDGIILVDPDPTSGFTFADVEIRGGGALDVTVMDMRTGQWAVISEPGRHPVSQFVPVD